MLLYISHINVSPQIGALMGGLLVLLLTTWMFRMLILQIGQNPEFYLTKEITFTLILKCYTNFTRTASNLSVCSMYLTDVKLELTKERRMFSGAAQFKVDLLHKMNGQCLQRKLNKTCTHFDG